MAFQIKKAERKEVYVKIALMAPSGGGKTYSSLRLAAGMASQIKNKTGKDAKILMINTESNRGYYYANEFDYDILDLTAPFTPERYIEAINLAVTEGYDILIIDSTSHEWEGKGGCLELQQKAGGKYQDWAKVTPRHNKFIDTLANSKIHILATMRGKDQYDMSKDDNGRTSVQKLGIGAKQREGFEYEFTCTFNIDQKTSVAEVQKDNTHIFDSEAASLLTETHGEKLIDWATSGKAVKVEVKKPSAPVIEEAEEELIPVEPTIESDPLPESFDQDEELFEEEIDYASEVARLFKETKDKELKAEVRDVIKSYGKISDCPADVLQELYTKLS